MKMARLPDILWKLFFAWICSACLTQLILPLLNLPAGWLFQMSIMLVFILVLASLTWGRYNLLAGLVLLLLTAATLWLTQRQWLPRRGWSVLISQIQDSGSWAWDFLQGYTGGTPAQLSALALAICLLAAAAAYLLIARFNIPLLTTTAVVTVFILARDLPAATLYGWIFPAGVVAIASWGRKQHKTYRFLRSLKQEAQTRFMLQAIPAAVTALILALLMTPLIPANLIHSRDLEGLVDDLTSMRNGMTWDQQNIPDFNLAQSGYYPLIDRLGGPAVLSDQAVLEVNGTTEALLLRGSISQTYDGHRWIADQDDTYYRYGSQLWPNEQTDIFNLDLPDYAAAGLAKEQLVKTETVRWSPLNTPTRIVFLAGRPISIDLEEDDPFLVYFRSSGQLFSKYWLQPRQVVRQKVDLLQTQQTDFSDAVRQIQAKLPAGEESIPGQIQIDCLQIPALPDYMPGGQVYDLVESLVGEEQDPYQKVLILRRYLNQTCTYNLSVSIPPADVDFVTWFIQTKEGYCVYFATALAMMCRLAGVPARYIEGYFVPGAEEALDIRVVTGKQAHAWTEIYLAGVGWLAVDATPGTEITQPDPDPNATPKPKPTAKPTSGPTSAATPTAAPRATPRPTPAPGSFAAILQSLISPWWLLLLLLLPMIYSIRSARRLKRQHDPAQVNRRWPDRRQAAAFYWSECKDLLAALGTVRRPGETPSAFVRRQCEIGSWLTGRNETLALVTGALEKLLYGRQTPEPGEIAAMAGIYDVLEKTLKQNSFWPRYFIKRILMPRRHGQKGRFML
ncbi:MAG: transglutaminase domain-containing protein [Clostridiaceae bacterium]|nr:transglutaminase domain-containing protein [Clostridiaceae bacterium]